MIAIKGKIGSILLLLVSLNFIVSAIQSFIHGEYAVGIFVLCFGGGIIGIAYLKREEHKIDEVHILLMGLKDRLKSGKSVFYQQIHITPHTILTRFEACASFLIYTKRLLSELHFVEGPVLSSVEGQHELAKKRRLYFTLITLFFGWWAFPLGPIYTVRALYINLRGGRKQTVLEVIEELEKDQLTHIT